MEILLKNHSAINITFKHKFMMQQFLEELSLLDNGALICTCEKKFMPSYKYFQCLSISFSFQGSIIELEKPL